MLRAIDGAHLLLLPDLHRRARDKLLPNLRVLRPLEPVEQVRAQRPVEIRLQARYDRREQYFRVFQSMSHKINVQKSMREGQKRCSDTHCVDVPWASTYALNSSSSSTTFGFRGKPTS